MKTSSSFTVIIALLISAHQLPAPISEMETPTPRRAPTAKPKPKVVAKPKVKRAATPTSTAPQAIEPETSLALKPTQRFDGTWVGTGSKNIPGGGRINGIYTMVIKGGKTAVKTLDTTNITTSEKPFDNSITELRRKWECDSTDLRAEGFSLTIQWSAGQLSDWTPRTIPSDVIQGYGNPTAETSVYTLKGDELKRINDPNGITYRRVK